MTYSGSLTDPMECFHFEDVCRSIRNVKSKVKCVYHYVCNRCLFYVLDEVEMAKEREIEDRMASNYQRTITKRQQTSECDINAYFFS